MAGALTPWALVVVIIPSHRMPWGKVTFKIKGEKGRCYSDSLKIGMVG
jgi:hypothetical protein